VNVFIRVLAFALVVSAATFAWIKLRPAKAPAPSAISASTSTAPQTSEPAATASEPAVASAPPAAIPPVTTVNALEAADGLRVWTSRDGRTTKAAFVARTSTTATIRRSDGQVFTIPVSTLAASDAAWIAQQPLSPEPAAPKAAPAVTQKQIDQVVADFPAAPALNGYEVTNELQQLHTKYLGMVKFIRPATIEANLKMIRSKVEDDIKRLSPIAKTSSGDWSGKRNSTQSAAAENGILSARAALGWLEGTLTPHLQAYDTLTASAQ